jgi:dihydropyrimidinase
MRMLISGGLVVGPSGSGVADVLVDGEKIVGVCTSGSEISETWKRGDTRVVDASGLLVIPGGIDGHTHMEMPFGGTQSVDTFESGTRAAAHGGTTTIVDFAIQPRDSRNNSLVDGFDIWSGKAYGQCAIDYGFHMIMSDVNDSSLAEMDRLVGLGVSSFKLFMAYPGVFYSDDGQILRAMQKASDNGATIMMHAENGIAIDVLVAQALARGETDPRFHGNTRPSILEGEATHRAICLAQVTGAPLYIVHLTAAEALAEVTVARDRGQKVFAETCPQYLYLSEDNMAEPGFEGSKYVCSPPLRHHSHQDELWRGLATDDLSLVATDHCPFCYVGQKDLGVGDFSKIPNGMPGVEHRVELMYQGVLSGKITLSRWVELCSSGPAKMFGLEGTKGVITPGADADIVLFDPAKTHTLSAATHHMKADYSAYEGMELTGEVVSVFSRGAAVIEDGAYVGHSGAGKYLSRGLNGYLG